MIYTDLNIPFSRDGLLLKLSPSNALATYELHAHRELELNLVLAGKGEYFIQGGRYSISPGSLLWLFPGQPHLLVDASDDFTMWIGVFRPRLIRRVSGEAYQPILSRTDPGTVYVRSLDGAGFRFLDGICRQLHDIGPGDEDFFNCGLGFLLRSGWERGSASRITPASSKVHPAVERAIHLMKRGDLEGSLVELASRAGLSYSRLCSLFRAQTGEPMGDFRERLRVERFLRLSVQNPRRTLLDLALESGFGSYAQCHRSVKKQTGSGPARFRKEYLEAMNGIPDKASTIPKSR